MASEILTTSKAAIKEWSDDKASRWAAAMAYYTVFALAPLLVIAVAVAGFVYGEAAAQNQIVDQLSGVVGPGAAETLQDMIASAGEQGGGILATIIGVATLFFAASGLFVSLRDSLNMIFDVEREGGGWQQMVKERLIAFAFVLGVGALLLAVLAANAVLGAIDQVVTGLAPGAYVLIRVANYLVTLGLMTVVFAVLFKYLPTIEVAWRDVFVGGAVTAVLFTLGQIGISLYLGYSSPGSVFGAAGSLAVLLIWIYYSYMVFFMGAEFTQVYANRHGRNIRPAEGAVPIDATEPPQEAGLQEREVGGDRS